MHIDNFILYIRLWKRKRLDTSSWEKFYGSTDIFCNAIEHMLYFICG